MLAFPNFVCYTNLALKCTTRDPRKRYAEGGYKMQIHQIVLTVLEVIASVLLILVVLFQSGKSSGLSGAISGNSDSYMNKSKVGGLDKKLATATKWIALVWILLTLALCLVNAVLS